MGGDHESVAESVIGDDVIPIDPEFTFPARPVEFQSRVDRTISDAHDDRVAQRFRSFTDTDSMEFEVVGLMASGDEEEVVPSSEFVMPNVEMGAVPLAFQRLDSVNLRDVGGDMRRIELVPTMCARREDGSC